MTTLPDAAEASLSTAQTKALLPNLTAAITAISSILMPAASGTYLFASNNPFDLTTRSCDCAFEDISNTLDTIWYGMAQTFPYFSSSLTRRANDGEWDRVIPQGILKVNGKNVFEGSQSITEEGIFTARIARTDPRSIQNYKASFKCLKSSITPLAKSTIFDHHENKPT